MKIIEKNNKECLSWVHEDGRCPVSHVMLFAKSGTGKGMSIEFLAEEWQKVTHGCVIYLCDPKKTIEAGFALFKPEAPYHLDRLRKDGLDPESHEIKLYHPYCSGIPKYKLPEINFYSLSIKDMSAEEFGILSETDFQNESIELMLRVSRNLDRNAGLFEFLHEVERLVLGKGKKRKFGFNPDPKNFYLRIGAGTAKSITQIASHLAPFKDEYFLRKDSCPYSLNTDKLIKILNDNSCYHVFFTRFINKTNKKMHGFITLSLFKRIADVLTYHDSEIKIPTLVIIPDVLSLCPEGVLGYQMFLARAFEVNLRNMRNTGRGFFSLLDSQSWFKTSSIVKDGATVSLFGELDPDDSDRVSKAMSFRREHREYLQNMNGHCKYLMAGSQDKNCQRIFLARHMHKEEGYVFLEKYKKYFPDKMKTYVDLIKYMKQELIDEERNAKNSVDKQLKELEEEEIKNVEDKKANSSETKQINKKIEKAKQKESEINLNIKKAMYEMSIDKTLTKRQRSAREIGKIIGEKFLNHKITHPTVKKYISDYESYLKNPEDKLNKEDIEPMIGEGILDEEIDENFEEETLEKAS